MKKIAIAGGALAALVVAAAVAAPYWTGQVAEEQIRALAARSEAQFGIVTNVASFERDYAQSRAVTVTELPEKDGETVTLTVDHLIDHGPKIGQASLARVESTLRLPDDAPADLRKALGDQSPLRVVTLVQADGSYDIDASVPSFEVQADGELGEAKFSGITGTAKIGANAASVDALLTMPGLQVVSPDMQLDLGTIEYKGNFVAATVPNIYTGPFEATMASMRAAPSDPGEPPVNMTGLRVDGALDTVDDGYGMNFRYRIDAIAVAEQAVRNVVLAMRLQKIDANALAEYTAVAMRLNESLRAATTGDAEAMQALNARVAAAGLGLITTGNPTLHLEALDVDYGDGQLRTSGKVQYVGNGDLGGFNPLVDLVADLDVKASESMVMSVASQVLARRTYQRAPEALSEEELATIDGATRYQLAEMMRTGMVAQEEDGSFRVRAVLDRGGVLVNDAPTPFLPPPRQ